MVDKSPKDTQTQKPKKPFSTINQSRPETKFLQDAIHQLQTGDDMDIMTSLITLCDQLSISSDQIADDPNMSTLLTEVCKQLEKSYITELIIYALQCINYILDINPAFTSIVKKVGAIPKIMILMSAIEDMTCLESIIKVVEKISYENSYALLENNTFLSLINIIDFLGESQKKSVMKTCLNMSINSITPQAYNAYIKPALPILAMLIQFNPNDIHTCSTAILIYYYISFNMKTYGYNKTHPEIEKDLLDYCILDYLFEIVRMYLANESNKVISIDLTKTVIKIFQIIAAMSDYSLNKMLKMNLLNIIIEILQIEFMDNDMHESKLIANNNSNSNSNKSNNHPNVIIITNQPQANSQGQGNSSASSKSFSFLNELFPLITALFPTDSSQTKILSETNREEYTLFLKQILMILVKQIMHKSACSTLISFIKLTIIVARNASKETIIEYIDDIAIAQIISKLVDTKYLPYMSDIITITDILMEKTPLHFIVSFMREGIIDHLKNFQFNYKEAKATPVTTTPNAIPSTSIVPVHNETDVEAEADADADADVVMETDTVPSHIKETITINSTMNPVTSINIIESMAHISQSLDNINNDYSEDIPNEDEYIDQMDMNEEDYSNIPKEDDNKDAIKGIQFQSKLSTTVMTTEKLFTTAASANIDTNTTKAQSQLSQSNEQKTDDMKFKEIAKEFKNTTEKLQKINTLLSRENKRIYYASLQDPQQIPYTSNHEIKTIETKLKDLIAKYFTDEMISKMIKDSNCTNDPIKIKASLVELKQTLTSTSNNTDALKTIINRLSDQKKRLTLFELENSGILIALCEYFDSNFIELYKKVTNENIDINLIQFPNKINKDIYYKVQSFIDSFNKDKLKLCSFIEMLQYTITSMNCFTMNTDDILNKNLNLLYNNTLRDSKRYEMKVVYQDGVFNSISKETLDSLGPFGVKLTEYHNAFVTTTKDVKLLITSKSTFTDIRSILLSNTGISFETNDKYEVQLVFMLEIEEKKSNIKKRFDIKANWTIRDIMKEISKVFTKEDLGSIIYGLPVLFGLSYVSKEEEGNIKSDNNSNSNYEPNTLLNKKAIDSKQNKPTSTLMISKANIIMDDQRNPTLQFIIDPFQIDKTIFEKVYHEAIIYNKYFYEIKRLIPSLFLLAILYYPLIEFKDLFTVNSLFTTTEELHNLFINPKVTLLIARASRDGYSVSRGSVPTWCRNLSFDFNFLSKFQSRLLLFKISFDPRRSLINLQNYLKHYANESVSETSISISKSMRLKIVVERQSIIAYVNKIFKDPTTSKFSGYLEFEYLNEIGNGIGPTLEFYTSAIDVFRNDASLWYKTTDNSHYPLPYIKSNALSQFVLLGFIVARALYDDRLLDMPFSRIFWDVVLQRAVPLRAINVFDSFLGKTIADFNEVIKAKKAFIAFNTANVKDKDKEKDMNECIKYNNVSIKDLGIYFTLPGYDDIEIVSNGKDILLTIDNIEEYVEMIYNTLFIEGIEHIFHSFRTGFNQVFPIENMKHFTSIEIEESICGNSNEKWDNETLMEYIKPEHGITKSSRVFKDLIAFMAGLNNKEQRVFLTFVTGTSRLPYGGFKSLNPKLTVVKRTTAPFEKPDDFLPTVMTCQNYLKLPDYSSSEILKGKFTFAMYEGRNEFHLS